MVGQPVKIYALSIQSTILIQDIAVEAQLVYLLTNIFGD